MGKFFLARVYYESFKLEGNRYLSILCVLNNGLLEKAYAT